VYSVTPLHKKSSVGSWDPTGTKEKLRQKGGFMKTCPKCGKEMEDGAVVCKYCGKVLASSEQIPVRYLWIVLALLFGFMAAVISRRFFSPHSMAVIDRVLFVLSFIYITWIVISRIKKKHLH
jgi:uncharacterized membrane protein YvbJ